MTPWKKGRKVPILNYPVRFNENKFSICHTKNISCILLKSSSNFVANYYHHSLCYSFLQDSDKYCLWQGVIQGCFNVLKQTKRAKRKRLVWKLQDYLQPFYRWKNCVYLASQKTEAKQSYFLRNGTRCILVGNWILLDILTIYILKCITHLIHKFYVLDDIKLKLFLL